MSAVLEVREPSARYLAPPEPALLRGFGLLAAARGGIAKLRKLILSLAVQGKLVRQELDDESAQMLLKALRIRQNQMIADGAIRREKVLPPLTESDIPFDLPIGWEWARLGDLANFVDYRGKTPVKTTSGVPLITAKNVRQGHINCEPREFIADSAYDGWMTRGLPRVGDLLFTTEAPLGNVAAIDIAERFALAQRVICLGLYELGMSGSLKFFLMSPFLQNQFASQATGVTAQGIKSARLQLVPIPVPPLAEQHRIVARVEELMKLCDALEQSGRLADEQHARLTSTLFDALAASESAHALVENWQRVAEHFDLLLDRPEAIDAFEQTILQLAVRGLLVPQDASEGTGDDLVERQVQAARTSGKRARTELLSLTQEDGPFIIPPAWAWTRFGEVADVSGGVTLGRKGALTQPVTLPYLRVANVQRGQLNLVTEVKTVTIGTAELPRFQLKEGDLLITEGGDWDKVGRTCIWREEIATCLHQNHVFKARGHTSEWLPAWGELYLNSADARAYFAASAKQTTNLASINMTELRNCMFPLPPVAEQQRILARVEELRRLCVQLRKRLTEARQTQALLADALVAQATAA